MSASTDNVLRTMTDDGAFRVVVAQTTDTVRGAVTAQEAEGTAAAYFADLMTGVVLVRETMAPALRVQTILRPSERSGTLVTDSHPTGKTRGLVSSALAKTDLDVGRTAVLQVMRTLHDGRLHQGIVEVPKGGRISDALMVYMQVSEQVTSMIAVDTVFEGGQPVAAGGYLVQLLPGAPREPVEALTHRLEAFSGIRAQLTAGTFSTEQLTSELMGDTPFTRLGESEVEFGCWCSQLRMIGALATLPRKQVQELVDEGEVLEISCDYCKCEYRVSPSELRGLLDQS